MTTIAVITARGGSKRIPRKNIRMFHGRPIIEYSIETAKKSNIFNDIYVSTDHDETREIAHRMGVGTLTRPANEADDGATTMDVMQGTCKRLGWDGTVKVCCIYPTAPMMSAADLRRGHDVLRETLADYTFAVGTEPLHDAGQFYWGWGGNWTAGRPIYTANSRMIPIASLRVCDINNEEDWQWALGQYTLLRKKGLV